MWLILLIHSESALQKCINDYFLHPPPPNPQNNNGSSGGLGNFLKSASFSILTSAKIYLYAD